MKSLSVLVIAAALASCATAPAEPPQRSARAAGTGDAGSDQLLANAVYSKLNADPIYYYRHVDVRVDQGTAHLSGYVWSADAIYRARQIAQSVPGITGVVTSQLELERNGRSNGIAR